MSLPFKRVYILLCVPICCVFSMLYADAKSDGEKGIQAFRQGKLIEAMQLLQQSAELNYAPAQNTLAYILDQSEQDKQAFHWFQQAALQGHAGAQLGLGNMYAKGEGVDKDPVKAGSWIEKSAHQNYLPAMRALSYALESGNLGFSKDKQAAGIWFLKAANAGDTVSMRRLTMAYRNNDLGLELNLDQAIYWDNKINKLTDKP